MPRPKQSRRKSPAPRADRAPILGDGLQQSAPGTWWRAAFILIAGSLVYLNSVSNPFVFDDTESIVDNEHIRHLWDLASVLLPERETPLAGRPVVNVSFAINYAMGALNVAGYHITNIAVHVLCAVLLFAIVRRGLQLAMREPAPGARSTNMAFAA